MPGPYMAVCIQTPRHSPIHRAKNSAAVAAAMTGFTPLSAFSMLVFILLYVPCVAATSTMAKELGSAKWTAFSVCWQIGVAYVVSLLVHTVGLALGFV